MYVRHPLKLIFLITVNFIPILMVAGIIAIVNQPYYSRYPNIYLLLDIYKV